MAAVIIDVVANDFVDMVSKSFFGSLLFTFEPRFAFVSKVFEESLHPHELLFPVVPPSPPPPINSKTRR